MTHQEKLDMFEENRDLAYKLANKYYGAGRKYGLYYEDIEQASLIALWRAIERHDENKGKLSTILKYIIKDEVNAVRRLDHALSFTLNCFKLNTDTFKDTKSNTNEGVYEYLSESIKNVPCTSLSYEAELKAKRWLVYKLIERKIPEKKRKKCKDIYKMLLKGYSQTKAAEKLGIKRTDLNNHYRKLVDLCSNYETAAIMQRAKESTEELMYVID